MDPELFAGTPNRRRDALRLRQDKPALPFGTPLWVNSFGIHEKPRAVGGYR